MKCDCDAAEELRQLRETIHRQRAFNPDLGLTEAESRVLALVAKRDIITPEQIVTMSSDKGAYSLKSVENSSKVIMYRIRTKLRPYHVQIYTRYGEGYYMDETGKERLQALIKRI